jgi:hypothetical protein
MFLGKGARLFDHMETLKAKLEIVEVTNSPTITHLKYKIAPV